MAWSLLAAVALENLEGGVGAESDGVDRDALIGGVDEVHEAHLGGQLHGQEAVGLDPQPGEVSCVGDRRKQQRYRRAAGVRVAEDADQQVVEPEVWFGGSGIVAQQVELDVGTEQRAELARTRARCFTKAGVVCPGDTSVMAPLTASAPTLLLRRPPGRPRRRSRLRRGTRPEKSAASGAELDPCEF